MNGFTEVSGPTMARRTPCASLLLAAAALVIYAFPALTLHLQYDRVAITGGEIWRMVTSHWTHVSGDHLFWDVLSFVVLGTFCERLSRGRFLACIIGAAIFIPAAIWMMLPQLETYRGLSGIDSALYILLVMTLLKEQIEARSWGWVGIFSGALAGFIAKVAYEVTTATTVFVGSELALMIPIPLAHAAGAAVGLIVGFLHWPDQLARPEKHARPVFDTSV